MSAFGYGPSLALRWRRMGAAFDFTGGVLPDGATLARGSAATRVAAGGVVASVAAGAARFDWDPVTLVPRGLLVEAAASNLLSYAVDLGNANGWTRSNVNVAANPAVLAPDGTVAPRLIEQSGGTSTLDHASVSFVGGTTYCLSLYAREDPASAKRYLYLLLPAGPFGGSVIGVFDLATGAITTNGQVVASSFVDAGGGWRRVSMTATAASAGSATGARIRAATTASTGATSGNDGVSGLFAWGVQLEQAGAPSSLVLTDAAPATRAADVLTLAWGSCGVADGAIVARVSFADGSSQDVAQTVSGGVATLPVPLARARVTGVRLA